MVVTAGLLSITWVQSVWPLPVTRFSDTVYSATGRRNSGGGGNHKISADVEVSDDIEIVALISE